MNRPFAVSLPDSFDMGQLIGTQTTVLAALGWDLGMKYDAHMRPQAGPDWLEQLRLERWHETGHQLYKAKLVLTDPSFVLNEPYHHTHSPLRACLPGGAEFYDLLKHARSIRNSAQHFTHPLTADLLRGRVKTLGRLAYLAQLPLAQECKAVLDRINVIDQSGPIARQSSGLRQRFEEEQERAKRFAVEADAARERMKRVMESHRLQGDQNAQLEAELDALRLQIRQADAARTLADDQKDAARQALQVTNAGDRAQTDDRVDALTPGDPWPGAPSPRLLRLLPHVRDLFDPAAGRLLSDDVGLVAVAAADAWRTWLPNGGPVHLNTAGQACALVGAGYIYLGALDDQAPAA